MKKENLINKIMVTLTLLLILNECMQKLITSSSFFSASPVKCPLASRVTPWKKKKKKTYSVKAKPTDYQVYYFLKHKKGLMQPAQRNEKRERKAALTSSTSGSSYCGSIFFSELGSALNLSAENINTIEPPLEYSLWNN